MKGVEWIAAVAICTLATETEAGAWAQPKGRGQIIVKGASVSADDGYDPAGVLRPLPARREDSGVELFAEYGLTDKLTLQVKGDWQSGQDAFVDYEGRGPLEIGMTWQAWRDAQSAVSLYAGYAQGGAGRNAGYSAPGVGDRDWEVRASAGRSLGGPGSGWVGRLAPRRSFVELQAARRIRDGLPDETRVDATLGTHVSDRWMLLGQAFGGATDNNGARWLSVETSVVRHLGSWSLQAGWRQTVAGRETPLAAGPVVALWRRF